MTRRSEFGRTSEKSMPTVIELRSHFDIPDWLVSYHNDWLRPDIIAGLTAAAVVIPKSMAYASIASLPVQVRLYTAFLPMIIYALLGTSGVLSVSTTTTLAILAVSRLVEVVSNGSTDSLVTAGATLTILVGVILTLAFLLKLGFVANFISQSTN
jgi:SulP family sulfate permease